MVCMRVCLSVCLIVLGVFYQGRSAKNSNVHVVKNVIKQLLIRELVDCVI